MRDRNVEKKKVVASPDPVNRLRPSIQSTQNGDAGLTNESVGFDKDTLEQSIPERFETIVRQYPYRLAVNAGDRSSTYEELNHAANRIARAILEKRGQGSEPVALLFEHGIDVIAAIFGILKAGKFYLALSPSFPFERNSYMLEDSQAALIVTNRRNAHLARCLTNHVRTCLIIDESKDSFSCDNLACPIAPDHLAILSYTSGSTGHPKGVIEPHRNILYGVLVHTQQMHTCPEDRLSLVHSVSFGSAKVNLFQSLLNGASLFLFDIKTEGIHRLAMWLRQQQITVFHSSPALFRQLAEAISGQKRLPCLRVIHLTGAPITRLDFDLFKQHFPPETILDIAMGSTEAKVICTYTMPRDFSFPEDGYPVGYPSPGNKVFLIDQNGRQVGPNQIGEIAVKSRYLATGYWKRPELNKTKFLPDPSGADERTYLTGDLGRMAPDGFLIYLGRKDSQVKIRGYRVELAEIESALSAHPQIAEAAVVAWDREPGEKHLVAYVVSRQDLTTNDLYQFLGRKLPDYMMPATFMFLKALPLTNGKLDRTALPLPDHTRPKLCGVYVLPRTPIEIELAKIWQETLQVHPIGIHDDFFALGGHSLLGARLISRMNEIFKVDLPLRDLFECSTVAALANRIEGKDLEATQDHRRNAGSEALITLHREPGDKRIFCFPYRGGFRNEYFNFSRISRYLAGLGYSFYGLGSRGVDGIGEPRRSVKEIGADYLEAIQRLQPHGPYYLIGECGGGILAHAVAERLQCLGEKVALLILFDTQAWSLGASIWWRLTERKRSRHILGFERDLYRTPRIWGYFGARMKLHLKELRRLKRYSQRFRYFLDKAANTVTAVPYFLQRDTSVHHQGVNLRIDNNTAQDLKRAEKTYFLAAHRYRYHRYKGRIALLVNEEWHASDPTLGWDKFAAGGLDVYKIPGNHDTCIPDNIPLVAELLRERLAKADAASKQWI